MNSILHSYLYLVCDKINASPCSLREGVINDVSFFFLRNYLEWMVDLPWSKETTDKLDISQAR